MALTHKRFMMLAAILVFPLMGCTMTYKPCSAMEKSVFAKANFKVYPEDVRGNPEQYRDMLVAWTGIVTKIDFIADPVQPYCSFQVEHHYFDWIEDYGAQKARYLLSPRGEGAFKATWPLKKEWDLDAMRRLIQSGDMMVVYGNPKAVDDGVIDLGQAAYVRQVAKGMFSTEILNYGRR